MAARKTPNQTTMPDWRLLSKVRVQDAYPGVPLATPCWLWTASTMGPAGKVYSQFPSEYGMSGHRASFAIFGGTLVHGMTIDHLCRNKLCVNPDHLEQVSYRENSLRSSGPLRRQIAATTCPRGHEYTDANTYRQGSKRSCLKCRRDYASRRGAERGESY